MEMSPGSRVRRKLTELIPVRNRHAAPCGNGENASQPVIVDTASARMA
jgi:hypothetical protein